MVWARSPSWSRGPMWRRESKPLGTKFKTKNFDFGAFIEPSGQNQLYHTPLLSKIGIQTKWWTIPFKIFYPGDFSLHMGHWPVCGTLSSGFYLSHCYLTAHCSALFQKVVHRWPSAQFPKNHSADKAVGNPIIFWKADLLFFWICVHTFDSGHIINPSNPINWEYEICPLFSSLRNYPLPCAGPILG